MLHKAPPALRFPAVATPAVATTLRPTDKTEERQTDALTRKRRVSLVVVVLTTATAATLAAPPAKTVVNLTRRLISVASMRSLPPSLWPASPTLATAVFPPTRLRWTTRTLVSVIFTLLRVPSMAVLISAAKPMLATPEMPPLAMTADEMIIMAFFWHQCCG
jgi:hypothetical protein